MLEAPTYICTCMDIFNIRPLYTYKTDSYILTNKALQAFTFWGLWHPNVTVTRQAYCF